MKQVATEKISFSGDMGIKGCLNFTNKMRVRERMKTEFYGCVK